MAAAETNQNGMNLLWLDSAAFWANVAVVVFGALAAIAAVFALYFSLRRDAAKDADLARFQQASKVSIANADARAAEANGKAAAAEEGTARSLAESAAANTRTKLLEVEAASQRERAARAEKDLLELRQRLAGRRLSVEQKNKLTSLLKPFSGTSLSIHWVGSGGQEAVELVNEIQTAIIAAGIIVPNRNILIDVYMRGIAIKFGANRKVEAEVIASFLIEVGLSPKPVPAETLPIPDDLVIMVGSKPDSN